MRHSRKAFTLMELMVVIGILVVLIGIVVIGLGALTKNQKEKATRQILESLVSMQQELKTANNLRDVHSILVDPGVRRVIAPDQQNLYNNDAIVQTQRMMKKLLTVPANKSVMQNLPADRFLSNPPSGVSISPSLAMTDGKFTTALPLDAWGTPIIYVPPPDLIAASGASWDERYGLDGVILKNVPDPHKVLNPRQPYPANNNWLALQTFQPFFASAGPDGDFSKGDDNVYSFEN